MPPGLLKSRLTVRVISVTRRASLFCAGLLSDAGNGSSRGGATYAYADAPGANRPRLQFRQLRVARVLNRFGSGQWQGKIWDNNEPTSAPFGAADLMVAAFQGLTPLAIDRRPCRG